ncbi:hypothetical protein F4859DRAFT_7077 [Xylaria cf. heliscus]|nr:hypothetical protein F4859DRAFT_7077 [Xylaria cf. heliscus]
MDPHSYNSRHNSASTSLYEDTLSSDYYNKPTGQVESTELLSPGTPGQQRLSTQTIQQPRYRARGPAESRIQPGTFERLSQWAEDRWLFEIGALLISAATLGGIIVTLTLHADRPLPQWPFGITINALVSTLSTISKSALLMALGAAIGQRKWIRLSRGENPLSDLKVYDEASRGPWGSLSLLKSIGLRDMSSLGAVITILSLAIDPFLQQITKFESTPVTIGTSGISSRIIFEMNVSPQGEADRDSFAQIPTAFIPLANQGLYFDGDLDDPFSRNTLQLRPRSTGGNVTFQLAETLAICSQCANITHLLPPPENCMPGNDECCADGDCDDLIWKWELPNGASTGWSHYGDRSTMVLQALSNRDLLEINMTDRLTVLNMTMIAPTWIYVDGDYDHGAGRAGSAQECTLYWCVNKYESSLRGGVLTETLISSHSTGEREPNNVPFFSIKPPGSNASVARPDDSELYGNYSSGWINGSFLVNTVSHQLLRDYFLSRFLAGDVISLNKYNPGAPIPDYPGRVRLYSKVSLVGPENTTQFDLHGIFDAIAQGMTTVVRSPDANQPGTDALVNVEGTETAMEVIVRVRWVWIALPVTLLSAGTLFVFETLIKNSRWKLQSWKSSSLAVLFVGMSLSDEVEHKGAKKVLDMVSIARNYWPKLRSKTNV